MAGRAHGVVARTELLAAGVTPAEIKHRLGTGALIRVHPGVYRVGHAAPSIEARYMAAVKACGERALLAGPAAAFLLGLIKRTAPASEVIVPQKRRVAGVRVRRCSEPELDRIVRRAIPVTSVPRTLVDLAAVLPEDQLARAVHEAAVLHRTTPSHVERVLDRRHNWPGAKKLRRVIRGEVPVTLSRLEALFLRRLREAGLPLPQTNISAGGRRVDCRWPAHALTVELDSYRYHHTRHAWEQDRRREREARRRGDEFRRFSWADVAEEPRPMLADLAPLLDGGRLLSQDDT